MPPRPALASLPAPLLWAALAVLPLAGCVQSETARPFGQAYTEQFHQQLVGEAYTAPTPVEGLDGHLARRGMDDLRAPADEGPSFADVLNSLVDDK